MSLTGTLVVGGLFVVVMVGLVRVESAEQDPGADSEALARLDSLLTRGRVPVALLAVGGFLALFGLLIVFNQLFFEVGALLGLLEGTQLLGLFVPGALAVFLGGYGLSKQNGLGTAAAVAAGTFLAGVVFLFLIATDLTIGVVR